MKIAILGQVRGRVAGALLLPALLLAACGTEPTATVVPTLVPTVAVADTAVPPTAMAPTAMPATAMPATAVPATVAKPTETEVMTAASPTGAAAGGPAPAPTPQSSWTPGAHKGTIPAPAKLTKAGVLSVGSDASYPPQEYIDAAGNPVGVDIDIASEIASRMGLELNVVNFKFDDIIPALNAAQFDLVISAMTITTDRMAVVDFVPYFEAGQAVLVRKGNPAGIKTLDDLSGKTAVAQQGTVEEETLNALNESLEKAGKPKVNVLTYPNDTDAVDQLRVGRADATLHDSPVAAYYAALNPNGFEVAIPNFDSAPEGIATAKINKPMHDAVQAAVDAMKADGTMAAIMAKWGVK
ncbi:MAG TPA: transporter substrate-binding domain-containing protein [Chloroflexia bacterium]|nr:transporter substrate-binding domain-containing protein [Chloroflexia bacterium]